MDKGFTLIELIVVFSIIAVLSAIIFSGNALEQRKLALQRASFELIQNVREIQEMAMAAQEFDCNSQITHSFGLYFNLGTSYQLFADCNSNRTKDSFDLVIREVNLENSIEISDLSPSPLNVVFRPPDPVTYINGMSQGTEAEITFSLISDPGSEKKVKINTVGRTEIK